MAMLSLNRDPHHRALRPSGDVGAPPPAPTPAGVTVQTGPSPAAVSGAALIGAAIGQVIMLGIAFEVGRHWK